MPGEPEGDGVTVRSALKLIGSLIGAAGVAASITLMSLGMRSVLAIGGSCASGNTPYEIRQACPKGVAWMLPVAIWAGLGFLLLFYLCAPTGGKRCAILAWPGLFLALGWNFLQFGLPKHTHGEGVDHGWQAGFLVPGILFIIMGIVPLIVVLPGLLRTLRGVPEEPVLHHPGGLTFDPNGLGTYSMQGPPPTHPGYAAAGPPGGLSFAKAGPPPTTRPTPSGDMAEELAKLAALHRSGDLTDQEYETAKQAVLAKGGRA